MRVLLIENRCVTSIWDIVAGKLIRFGFDVHWIVQNPKYLPRNGVVHIIPFPKKQKINEDRNYDWLRGVDRGVRWFGGSGWHWSVYGDLIEKKISEISPDVICGEATEFHELIAIQVAKERRIQYVVPMDARYPVGRIMFFKYDTLDCIGGDGEKLSEDEAEKMLESIVNRQISPLYMGSTARCSVKLKVDLQLERLRLVLGWIQGERFITPSPFKKLELEIQHFRNVRLWESVAHNDIPKNLSDVPWVLYPMQMQPESNIELYGRPWTDQVEIIRRASSALKSIGGVMVVKPNPKSKYELSNELISLIKNSENIFPLSHNVSMKSIFTRIPIVLTVTGTIALESVFSSKSVAVLGDHFLSKIHGVQSIKCPEEIVGLVNRFSSADNSAATRSEAIEVLKQLYFNSYNAKIWDPLRQPENNIEFNYEILFKAFLRMLRFI